MKRSLVRMLLAALMVAGFSKAAAEFPPDDGSGRYVFPLSKVSIPREIGGLKLMEVKDYEPDGSDVAAVFEDPARGIKLSMYVYKSPAGTYGPALLLNEQGKMILEDREEILKKYNAVFKLTEPSESFKQEYDKIKKSVSAIDWKLAREFRIMAIPDREDLPVSYSAVFRDAEPVRATWTTHLFSIPGFFVKIHYTCPLAAGMEAQNIWLDAIQAINWVDVAEPNARQAAPQAQEENVVEPPEDRVLYTVTREKIDVPRPGLTIKKQVWELVFQSVAERGEALDLTFRFYDERRGMSCMMIIYEAPDGTYGPRLLENKADQPEKYADPSPSFQAEYQNTVAQIAKLGSLTLSTREDDNGYMPVVGLADEKTAPVARLASFEGTGAFKHPDLKDVPWFWSLRLYAVGGCFVAINIDGPDPAAVYTVSMEMAQTIKWPVGSAEKDTGKK